MGAQQARQGMQAGQEGHDIRAAVLRPVRNGMNPSVVMTVSFDALRLVVAPGSTGRRIAGMNRAVNPTRQPLIGVNGIHRITKSFRVQPLEIP